MIRRLIVRLAQSTITITGLLVVVFFVTHGVGDPATLMLPLDASETQVRALREKLGYDDPLSLQFRRFFSRALLLDFGHSLWQGRPALRLILERLPATWLLASCTMVLAVAIAIPLGVLSARFPRSATDRLTSMTTLFGVSVPDFWLALILILVVAVQLGWLQTSGYGRIQHLVLPVLTLAARPIGRITQMVRSSMLDELAKQYVITARAKGLSEFRTLLRHVFRNAGLPVVTMIGDEFSGLINGAVVVETIFGWPGIGFLAIQAMEHRDLPLIVAAVFVVGVTVATLNLLVDISYSMLDPRIRYA